MPTIRIPSPLRHYTGGQGELAVSASTVAEAVDQLMARFPALKPHLCNEKGELRPFVNLFVNQVNSRDLDGLQTRLKEEDTVMIIPSIAGG